MVAGYFPMPGEVVAIDDLHHGDAKEIALAVAQGIYSHLVECRRVDTALEIVVFDVDVELSQLRVHDIHHQERLAAVCSVDHSGIPSIYALRDDFPLVPHLNIQQEGYPHSLCVFAEPSPEVRLQWTAPWFLERIRQWLALTAKGMLHNVDQPLEPLLPGSLSQFVIPSDIFQAGSEYLVVDREVDGGFGHKTLIAARPDGRSSPKPWYIATGFIGEAQTHGVISRVPVNLEELDALLRSAGLSLITELRNRLTSWHEQVPALQHCRLIVVIWLPKTREVGSAVEAHDVRAFITEGSIGKVGVELGIWGSVDGTLGKLVFVDESKRGSGIGVELVNVNFGFSPDVARIVGGCNELPCENWVLVGAGALGSQVLNNLARLGIGRWTLVDNDFLYPHNLARHALSSDQIGEPKALALAHQINQMLNTPDFVKGWLADAMDSNKYPELQAAWESAGVIVDTSTSIPVARYLTHEVHSTARRVSLFMNPSATDLVMLAEDQRRQYTLDVLEMQYYRFLLHCPKLEYHLTRADRVRYGNSCRDISAVIPQDVIALHSAIAGRAVRQVVTHDKAAISVWRSQADLSVEHISFPVAEPVQHWCGAWRLITDNWLLEKLRVARQDRLPNETGGILLGFYDMQRHIVYVADAILSPPDSQEWPTVYVRGYHGLKQALDRAGRITDWRLEYVGEWHSHPDGASCQLSQHDRVAYEWLEGEMAVYGHPALMLIVGQQMSLAVQIGEVQR
jgi:hypothetical protein